MATLRQIEANRRNAQKSTGPRTIEGKAVSRFNALKSGIDASSLVIRGEDPEALETLVREYHERFRPTAPEQRFLVDALVNAEWQLRRLRKVEAELWEYKMRDAYKLDRKCPLGHVFHRGVNDFTRLQRRVDSTERSYRRALEELRRLQSGSPAPEAPEPAESPEQHEIAAVIPSVPSPEPLPAQSLRPVIGFVPLLRSATSPSRHPAAAQSGDTNNKWQYRARLA